MKDIMLDATQWFIVVCAALALVKLVFGSGAAERLIALNVLSALALAFLVIKGVDEGRAIYLDVALVYDIFGFLGLLAVARFLRDKPMDDDKE